MPRKYTRTCPICGKSTLKNLSSHLDQVHDIDGEKRTRYLQIANSIQDNLLTSSQITNSEIQMDNSSNIKSTSPVLMKVKCSTIKKQLFPVKSIENRKKRSTKKVKPFSCYK